MAGDRQDYASCTARPGSDLWGPSEYDLALTAAEADTERQAQAAECGCMICTDYLLLL